MTERIWLSSYPAGVPADIDPAVFASLPEMLHASCARFAQRPALTSMGTTLDYAQLERLSAAFAAWLQHTAGVERGERVAIMLPNLLAHPVATFGVLRAGAAVVNVNPLSTARELGEQLRDSGAGTIVILENYADKLAAVRGQTGIRNVVISAAGDLLAPARRAMVNFAVRHLRRDVPDFELPGSVPLTAVIAAGSQLRLDPPALGHADLAFLQYTGGTTGTSKAAMLSHGNMVANVEQIHAWIAPFIVEGAETMITALPLYHIFALTANLLSYVRIGGLNVLVADPRDVPAFVRTLRRHRFTAINGVNTLFNALLNAPGIERVDFSHLKCAIGGGMAVQSAVAARWKQVTGTALLEAYGLTETAPAVCMNPLDLDDYNGRIGLPIPSTVCHVRDPDDHVLACGEAGELCVRGPQVMQGYWNRPEETRAVLDTGGWLRTGDIARMDRDGFFEIVDRKKDMILVSGFNVYPNEVEEVLAAHPQVLEAAAIGVPDAHSGEAVKVFVVARDPAPTAEELIAWCRRDLSAYKIPRQVEFRDTLPKSTVGKILRRALRDA